MRAYLVILSILLFSCSASKRLAILEKNHPELFKTDSISKVDTIYKTDTIVELDSIIINQSNNTTHIELGSKNVSFTSKDKKVHIIAKATLDSLGNINGYDVSVNTDRQVIYYKNYKIDRTFTITKRVSITKTITIHDKKSSLSWKLVLVIGLIVFALFFLSIIINRLK